MALPRGTWVTIEDQYDHDRREVGPFPTPAAAAEYCDAINGAQLKLPAGGAPAVIDRPTAVGVWDLAACEGYDVGARLAALLARPDDIPLDAEAIAARYGARPEHAWLAEAQAAIGAPRCWCRALRLEQTPEVAGDVLAAYLALGLEPGRALFATAQHHGDAGLLRCRPCGGAVLHLLVELESVGDGVHHYYTALDDAALAALADGTLGPATCEAWLGGRPGLYQAGRAARCYARAEVGYVGVDHRLYGRGAAPIAED